MKSYFKKMMIKGLIVIVVLFSGYGYLDYSVWHYDTVNTIHTAKAKNVKKQEEVKDEELLAKAEEEKKEEPAVEVQPVSQPAPAVPSVGANNIQIAGSLQRNLMKDVNGDNFYLNHNINGAYDGIGVPYIDYRTDFTTRKTIIYSHSSPNGNGPFQPLQNYHNNKGYYDGHRYISVNYNGASYTYEIFSVYVSLADSEESEGLEYFHRIYYDDEEWANRIQWYKNNSEYDTGVSVSASDKILILQTCSMDPNYYQRYYRANLVIMAKLV